VRATWSLSAFTVLIYYSLTNLAALRLPAERRLYPRWIAGAGLGACLLLAFWIDPRVLAVGAGAVAVGSIWHAVTRAARARSAAARRRPRP
jgi:APA family basic amino acid/polyamine antiporter